MEETPSPQDIIRGTSATLTHDSKDKPVWVVCGQSETGMEMVEARCLRILPGSTVRFLRTEESEDAREVIRKEYPELRLRDA